MKRREYATIFAMKAIVSQRARASYKRHRKEFAWQILLPVIGSVLLALALIVWISLAAFGGGDVGRWAAISTIWIVIPLMVAGLIFLIFLVALIYLIGRLLGATPKYASLAQEYVGKAARYVKRGAEATVAPIVFLGGVSASVRAFFGRK